MTPPPETDALAALLSALRASPFADRIRVFGSVMRGDPEAHDVDAVCDLDDAPFAGSIVPFDPHDHRPPAAAAHQTALATLLALVVTHGATADGRPRFNCFVRTEGRLLAPTPAATWWRPVAAGAGVWQKACTRGVALAAVQWPPAAG